MPNLRDEASNQLNSLISNWGCESPLTPYIPPGESLMHTFLSFLNLTDQLGTIAQVVHLGLSSFLHVLSVILPFVIRLIVYATKRIFFFLNLLFHSFHSCISFPSTSFLASLSLLPKYVSLSVFLLFLLCYSLPLFGVSIELLASFPYQGLI